MGGRPNLSLVGRMTCLPAASLHRPMTSRLVGRVLRLRAELERRDVAKEQAERSARALGQGARYGTRPADRAGPRSGCPVLECAAQEWKLGYKPGFLAMIRSAPRPTSSNPHS